MSGVLGLQSPQKHLCRLNVMAASIQRCNHPALKGDVLLHTLHQTFGLLQPALERSAVHPCTLAARIAARAGFDSYSNFGPGQAGGDLPARQNDSASQILTLAGIGGGESHIDQREPGLQAHPSDFVKGSPMLGYLVLSDLLRARPKTCPTVSELRQQVLLPRTAADELPPYRGQPWVVDGRGCRKIDPIMTLVPVNRL